jgi:hypothetical protein
MIFAARAASGYESEAPFGDHTRFTRKDGRSRK